jgi:hypothetical protein
MAEPVEAEVRHFRLKFIERRTATVIKKSNSKASEKVDKIPAKLDFRESSVYFAFSHTTPHHTATQ